MIEGKIPLNKIGKGKRIIVMKDIYKSKEEVVGEIICTIAGADIVKVNKGSFYSNEWHKVCEIINLLAESEIYFFYKGDAVAMKADFIIVV